MECALKITAACPNPATCSYHTFLQSAQQHGFACETSPLIESRRQLLIYPPNDANAKATGNVTLKKAGALCVSRIPRFGATAKVLPTPTRQLMAFLRLVNHMCNCPWSNIKFDVNYSILMRLTASHLNLIAPGADQTLCSVIDPHTVLEGAQNVCWITNRQQGKTSTLARFLAAVVVACPLGGLIFTVYSTSLDRSVELVKSAKQYIYWLSTDEGRHPDFSFTLERNNERMFAVRTKVLNGTTVVNQCVARPKNPESCRGDAPRAAIFDEVAFIGKRLWSDFAFPLLQVKGRVFTLATTPPAPSSWFSVFIDQVKARNKEKDYFFNLINHSLSCAACLEAGEAVDCCHNLAFVPPWKSLLTLNQMLNLATDKEAYQVEVYGILAAGGSEYIPAKLVDAALQRTTIAEPFATDFLWVSIDPPAHGVSDFAATAFVMSPTGVYVIVGMFNVNVKRCQTTEVQQIVHQFLARLRKHPLVGPAITVIPIIECNNNEILSMSILRVFEHYGDVHIPWTEDNFSVCISHGIGVWMSHENKMAMLQSTYQSLMDGRIAFADGMVVADKSAFAPNASTVDADALKAKWASQLKSMQDQPDGSVSGKHLGNDDLATACMQGIYWSMSARAMFMQRSML
jgi:hypothetical protein